MQIKPWSDAENDLIVADYFAMLQKDVVGQPYNKTEHRNKLMSAIGRSKGSIEYKHQNLSAVLIAFGQPWIIGYKPAFNFQDSLADAVGRYLATKSHPISLREKSQAEFSEPRRLWISTAPTLRNEPEPEATERLLHVARKFDVAGRDAMQRQLGYAGEERVLFHEQATLTEAGRADLARRVHWTSKEDGDGAGYDISSFDASGTPRLLEVKTTNGWDRTPFHISRNELSFANANTEHWRLIRVYDFAREPKAFELHPPLDRHVSLTATSFQADFH